MNLNELELMEKHIAALFNHDEAGRITGTNDGDPPGIAPRLFLGRTLKGDIWRFRDDVPDDIAAELTATLEGEPTAVDLREPPKTLAVLRSILARTGPVEHVDMGPAFRFTVDVPEGKSVETLDDLSIDLVELRFPDHYPWLAGEYDIRQPITAVVRGGHAVSICFSARLTDDAAEAGVDTAEAFRGHGFAVEVVRSWANGVSRSGRIPMYSTSWENKASQRVAAKLGLMMYGADVSIY